MKLAISLILIGGSLLRGIPAAAQCLALPDLLALSQPPAPTESAAPPPGLLTSWIARGPVMPGDTEQYWIIPGPDPASPPADSLARGWLGLRPGPAGPATARDVRYKVIQADCLDELRRALARARYPVALVTALDGEAVRFEAPTFSVTLYTLTKGQFRYVAVLHPRPPGASAPVAPPVNSRLVSPSGVPRLQPKYGTAE